MAIPRKVTKRVTAEFENAQTLARRTTIAAALIGRDTQKIVDEFAAVGVRIYRQHALGGPTGAVGKAVQADVSGGDVTISADPVDPKSGYHFIGVTRFGHRSNIIKPQHERRTASVIATRKRRVRPKSPRKGVRPALVIEIPAQGQPIFRAYVRGFHPIVDWTEAARTQANRHAQDQLPRVGNLFLRRVGGR